MAAGKSIPTVIFNFQLLLHLYIRTDIHLHLIIIFYRFTVFVLRRVSFEDFFLVFLVAFFMHVIDTLYLVL